jgi:medium-chain acyl-[acyl-carrier-protein] hydrolase
MLHEPRSGRRNHHPGAISNSSLEFDSADLWFRHTKTGKARQRLLCFPYAGGSASIFRNWQGWFSDDTEVVAIELPGRGFHIRTPLINRMETLIASLLNVAGAVLDLPFSIFGHSMGALIGFELCRALSRTGCPVPIHLFVSGMCAPSKAHLRKPAHQLPDHEFLQVLRSLSGTPPAVLEDRGLMELFLPILRADFHLAETYRDSSGLPISQPITVFGGLQDKTAPPESLPEWGEHTTAKCSIRLLDGDHFFIHQQDHVMAASIADSLALSAIPNQFVGPHECNGAKASNAWR